MPALPTVTDVKTYLGLTGTGDDTLITERVAAAISMAERDTGRVFSAASNTTNYYSSNIEAIIITRDMPFVDASRVVTWNGVTLTEGTNCWFLPDRRDPNTTHHLQLRPSGAFLDYRVEPQWFDRNLDRRWYSGGLPNDVKVVGIDGIPFPKSDVTGAILVLAVFLYWRAKSGASGTAYDLTGESFTLAETPPEYQRFVADWRIRTQVAIGG